MTHTDVPIRIHVSDRLVIDGQVHEVARIVRDTVQTAQPRDTGYAVYSESEFEQRLAEAAHVAVYRG